jgi:sugar/nucleoside kinase (ribokinase family)
MWGDIGGDIIELAGKKALAALDVQCLLRRADEKTGEMTFHDWPEKRALLPKIRFLKTDAAEAEILTGLQDRAEAAKVLYGWGAKEIMITHNTEVLVYDGRDIYTEPLKARNLTGRSGRGDTCFSAYITERLTRSIPEALLSAAALVSLKMEKSGPFNGTRADVEAYIREFYQR